MIWQIGRGIWDTAGSPGVADVVSWSGGSGLTTPNWPGLAWYVVKIGQHLVTREAVVDGIEAASAIRGPQVWSATSSRTAQMPNW